jgi:hypothetical protein
MSDLQASGLLKDGEEEGEEQLRPAQEAAGSPADASNQDAAPASSDAPLASETSEGSLGGSAGGASWETEPSESAGPAEQRVLGDLEGCPGWHEVRDRPMPKPPPTPYKRKGCVCIHEHMASTSPCTAQEDQEEYIQERDFCFAQGDREKYIWEHAFCSAPSCGLHYQLCSPEPQSPSRT